MSYPPDDQGTRWFADVLWPLVRLKLAHARLDVLETHPREALRRVDGRHGSAVHGFVPSTACSFAGAHVGLLPVLTGARLPGVQMKLGRRRLLVADEPREFAAVALHLLDGLGTRAGLAAEVRVLAERKYHWRLPANRLVLVLVLGAASTA